MRFQARRARAHASLISSGTSVRNPFLTAPLDAGMNDAEPATTQLAVLPPIELTKTRALPATELLVAPAPSIVSAFPIRPRRGRPSAPARAAQRATKLAQFSSSAYSAWMPIAAGAGAALFLAAVGVLVPLWAGNLSEGAPHARGIQEAPAPVLTPVPAASITTSGVRVLPEASDDSLTRVHFAEDSAELTPQQKQAIDQLVPQLKAEPQATITVVGFTERQGASDEEPVVDLELATRRAQAVHRYLVEAEVPGEIRYTTKLAAPDAQIRP